ncbi:MAG: saccharopine dehydrogenase [Parcubacteria group bacterium Gr01-1014_18]|nr:MAG: saccharopine dehydrogenase [Parcubacteria group bacterium Greene0416_36]TSC79753.1 MAG: saccharopine dehydrogenase [Parcubacteria group bacterium Gr01-1014_18]TSC97911.1 MAG: saccharopine dehydrogenase [Parcubacteria group bacterium Greene1014_20]TSD06569.1 MAG: saccharopine dehydrogenase [Parcubacteria group bacterium Greene0714_2]
MTHRKKIKSDFLIIGSSGMQGRIVARDLLESGYKVVCADFYRDGSEKNLGQYPGTPFEFVDLRKFGELSNFIKQVDTPIVINCAEGDWNHDVYRICLEEKKHVLDLGSDIPMTQSQLEMDKKFKKADRVAITGCGSTPGINNIMFAHAAKGFSEIDTVELGFAWDSSVKKFVVPFSMESIIEELTEPAPVVEGGKWGEKNPFDTEVVKEFREIGSEKCYLVRHPETYTFFEDYKEYGIKNIRFYAGFPDHSLEVIRRLIELGLGEKNLLNFEKSDIRPIDALSRILTRLEKPDNYTEKENLWVEISGKDKEGAIRITKMECLVSTIPGWVEEGCNIDTGFPASIIAQMILDGRISARGSFAPDRAVPSDEFFKELKKKGITIYQDGNAVN